MEAELERPPTIADIPVLDVRADAFESRPYDVLRQLRAQTPIAMSDRGIEVLRYADVQRILDMKNLYIIGGVKDFDHAKAPRLASFLRHGKLPEMAPERHAIARQIMGRAFALGRVDERVDFMRGYANSLVDEWIERGECRLIEDFSDKFPIYVACHLLGVDEEDIPMFAQATKRLHLQASYPIAPHVETLEAALEILYEFTRKVLLGREKRPRQDFATALIQSHREDGRLTDDELFWNFGNLLFAGHDTTRSTIAHCMVALEECPGAWARLRAEPALIRQAVREGQRYYPIVQAHVRVPVDAPVVIAGLTVEPGQKIMLNLLSTTRDPDQFEDPETFKMDREVSGHPIAFGHGVHHCIGHMLAKAELHCAFEVLTRRIEEFEVIRPLSHSPYVNRTGGYHEVPIRFRAA